METNQIDADLTRREREFLPLLAAGLPFREISRRVGLSEGTLRQYVHRFYRKYGLRGRYEAARWWEENCRAAGIATVLSRERFADAILRAARDALLNSAERAPDATPEFIEKHRRAVHTAFESMSATTPMLLAQLDESGFGADGLEN